MGGDGSGRRGWRPKVEAFQRLDVRELHRERGLRKDLAVQVTLGDGAPITLEVEWTRCHFGGERPWFRCPNFLCWRRVAVLYLYNGRFRCRHCLNLTYASTCQDSAMRASERYRKIMRRLGGDGEFGEKIPDRPDGMPRRTYGRLCQQAEAALAAYDRAFAENIPAWLRRMLLESK